MPRRRCAESCRLVSDYNHRRPEADHLGRSAFRLQAYPRRRTQYLVPLSYSADRGHVMVGGLSAHCRHYQLFKYSYSSFTNFMGLILASPDGYAPVPKNIQLNGKFWASSSAAPVCHFAFRVSGCNVSADTIKVSRRGVEV